MSATDHLEHLGREHGFTLEELEANRRGALHPRQSAKGLRKGRIAVVVLALLGFLALGGGLVGAGLFREALIAADQCPNIYLDTSSSNSWMKYYPGLTLDAVFRQAYAVVGASRLLFGTDSSFFPRGWQVPVYEAQVAALDAAGIKNDDRSMILGGNFDRLFPVA